jgi:hypothetical protein
MKGTVVPVALEIASMQKGLADSVRRLVDLALQNGPNLAMRMIARDHARTS